jgi:methionine biosynthesis protein MetW
LSQTLQTTKRPDLVLDHLLRIGELAFVSFPNFAQWRIRFAHMFGGRMPITKQLPDHWYDTPNIHHVTIDDFKGLVKDRGYTIEGEWYLSGDKARRAGLANLLAEHAVFLLRR